MHHIPTSSEDLSKLKKAAKLLARGDSQLQHADALDRVAKDAGYLHWKHVTTCAERSTTGPQNSPLATLTAAQCVDPRFARAVDQELILITGRSGSGKSVRAMDIALNWLREGKPVQVLDIGRSYFHMCRTVGGTFVTFSRDGSRTEERHGGAGLVVFELEKLLGQGVAAPVKLGLDAMEKGALLIVDEVWQMCRLVGSIEALNELLCGHLEAGVSVAMVSQDCIDSETAFGSIGIRPGTNIRRSHVSLGHG